VNGYWADREQGRYMVKIKRTVRNISMKRPRTTDVLGEVLRVVRTARGPGKSVETIPAAAMPASICEMKTMQPLIQPIAPMRQRPRVT
jgi:hypothetical protein